MIASARMLSWFIGVYIAVDLFAYTAIVGADEAFRPLFVLVPLCMLLWQAIVLRYRFLQPPNEPDAPFYERVERSDWWRVFWILWIGHRPFASDFAWGFALFSGLVAFLLGVLFFTASVEFYRRRTATPLLIGCLVFAYFLLVWEKNSYVIHYGVPIIGHFLEKPEYDAKYRVEVESESSTRRFQVVADIHVEGRTESEDWGEEDWIGRPISHTYTYRDVWLRKLYLPNGRSIAIHQQGESLRFGESVFVEDSYGRSWYVQLLNEPVQ